MLQYEDFSLKIEPKRGDRYPVIVLGSPAGEGRSSFSLSIDPDKVSEMLVALGKTVRGSDRPSDRSVSAATGLPSPQHVGDQLFRALFSDEVRALFDTSRGIAHERKRGLRIKLHIDPEDPSLAILASFPWEFLYRKERSEFLNLSRYTPIIRCLDFPALYPIPLEPPLRILVIMASPAGYPPLDLARERELIEDSWATQESVQVEFLEHVTILALQEQLVERPCHALHFMGHGDFHAHSGRGSLVMEDEYGDADLVDGRRLGILLRGEPSMTLAFLNACETARVPREGGVDPFTGVASSMVMAGIPAVVAMQFSITDRAAITFARRFYPLLARGHPVDVAVAEGRRAIRLAQSETMEWGTPVLFMRAPQGVIFQVTAAPADEPNGSPTPPHGDAFLELQLHRLYTEGLNAQQTEDWEQAERRFGAIRELRPDYKDAGARLEEVQRQGKLARLYTQAQAAQESADWEAALSTLEQLSAEAPNYRDAGAMLEAVRRQWQLANLYAKAGELHRAGQWQAVVNIFSQISAIEPEHPDPDGLLPSALHALEAPASKRVVFRWIRVVGITAVLLALIALIAVGAVWSVRRNSELKSAANPTQGQMKAVAGANDFPVPGGGTVKMVWVPAGEFTMGGNEFGDARPVHTVYLDSYWIDQTEVTNAQYAACVSAGTCAPPESSSSSTRGNYHGNPEFGDCPVVMISWEDAKTYCDWRDARLPTEAEWEKAARGTGAPTYPWGSELSWTYPWEDEVSCNQANFLGCKGDTTAVGVFVAGASFYGALDMAGNVLEWVADWYDDDYYTSPDANTNPMGPSSGDYRVLRGGAWHNSAKYIRAAYRFRGRPDGSEDYIGFRCARDASP